jgi:hypothetical protein
MWAIGDAGTGTAQQTAVRDAYLAASSIEATNLWAVLGDNAYNVRPAPCPCACARAHAVVLLISCVGGGGGAGGVHPL